MHPAYFGVQIKLSLKLYGKKCLLVILVNLSRNMWKKVNKHLSLESLVIPKDVVMTILQESTGPQFSLSETFQVELSNEEMAKVIFDEEALIESLYTDLQFYWAIGQQFCLVFDIFYANRGNEAVAESLYRVVEKEEMEGGQTLMNHA